MLLAKLNASMSRILQNILRVNSQMLSESSDKNTERNLILVHVVAIVQPDVKTAVILFAKKSQVTSLSLAITANIDEKIF